MGRRTTGLDPYNLYGTAILWLEDGTAHDLSTLLVGPLGWNMISALAGERTGIAVASAGNSNGDRTSDLVIGAAAGRAYVVFTPPEGFTESFDLESLDGTNGFVFRAEDVHQLTGGSVAGLGDVNIDGYDDVFVGIGNEAKQVSYLLFGSDRVMPTQPSIR